MGKESQGGQESLSRPRSGWAGTKGAAHVLCEEEIQ